MATPTFRCPAENWDMWEKPGGEVWEAALGKGVGSAFPASKLRDVQGCLEFWASG